MSHEETISIDIKSDHNGDALVFSLRGTLDVTTSPSVRAALIEAAENGKHEIIVDLSQVEFLDSTGLGALIGAHRRALEKNGRVRLVCTDGPIQRLLNITGLMKSFAVYSTLQAALADRDRLVSL
ncbi:MAG: STAS domain-containing protein [Candidatus Eremiobacteraeota bacterium]|nr:STAS domain-containing protein [Candidatus Eremiobacteraeota bacterium]